MLAGIANALKGELEDVLTSEGVPLWAREKVIEWSHFLAPVVPGKAAPVVGARRVSGLGPTGSPGRKASDSPTWEIAGDLTAAVVEGGTEEVARKMQEFWHELEDEVGKRWAEDVARERQKGRRWRRHPKAGSGSEGESERDKEEKEAERDASEQQEKEGNTDEERDSPKSLHVTRVMDAVERVICSLFYDRLVPLTGFRAIWC